MKHTRKFASLLLALVLLFALAAPAFAAETYSITVTNDKESISINGNTYYAYKLFNVTYNADGSSYAYTVTDEFEEFTYTKGENSYSGEDLIAYIAEQTSNTDEMNAIAEAALKYATDNGIYPANSDQAANETAIITLSDPGYYLVSGTATAPNNQEIVAACALTTTDPTADVVVKADAPSIEKKIDSSKDNDDTTTGLVNYNNAAIGDTVSYVVTSQVPDMIGYEKYYFVVNDTLSKGLTFNNDVAITVGSETLEKDTDFTVTTGTDEDGNTTIEIVFKNFIQYKDEAYKNAAITITYSATVNENAVIGTAGNPNVVTLTYSNNPNLQDNGTPETPDTPANPDKPTPDSPTGVTPEDEVRTYVTDLKILKVNEKKELLAGAEFQLTGTKLNQVLISREIFTPDEEGAYWKLRDGTYTQTDPVIADDESDTSKYYDSTDTKYSRTTEEELVTVSTTVKATGTTDENGELTFTGLSAGTYEIKEIKAPNGYNLLKDPIEVIIGWTAPETGSTDCTWTYTGTDTVGDGEEVVGTNHVTVVNQTGAELPSTGGMGTTLFYVIGFVLVVGAAVLLITKKRMSAEG